MAREKKVKQQKVRVTEQRTVDVQMSRTVDASKPYFTFTYEAYIRNARNGYTDIQHIPRVHVALVTWTKGGKHSN